ncbi:hypothetical protein HRbin29_01836 [bacterium HR29]|jgi:hypothetical protein|nr:hypothetical protein HRbin29_01836 [bacterium HR29]
MNAVLRLLVLVYSALFIAACGVLAGLAWNQDQQIDLDIENFNFVAYVDAGTAEKWGLTGALAVLVLAALGAILLAIRRPARGSRGTVRWRQADGSVLEMPATTIEGMLRDALRGLAGVRETRPIVRASGGTVATELELTVDGTVTVSELSHAASDITFRVLREQVGALDVQRPVVRIAYAPGTAPRPLPTPHTATATSATAAPPPIPPPPREEVGSEPAKSPTPNGNDASEGGDERTG